MSEYIHQLFLVIKEFEQEDPESGLCQNIVDNTLRIWFNEISHSYDVHVNRKKTEKYTFVPYYVSLRTSNQVIQFISLILFNKSKIVLDMYHGKYNPEETVDSIHRFRDYENDNYSVIGFTKTSRDASFEKITESLKLIKRTGMYTSTEETI